MKKFLLFSCLLLSICAAGRGQYYERQLISPAGDYGAVDDIQITWVIGDLVSGAYGIGQLILPYGTDIRPDADFVSSVSLFPNPASDKVYLLLRMEDIKNCSYWLYDILGREIQNGIITSERTELNLTSFECGVYLLRLIKENTIVKDFKIVKQ